MSSGIEDSPGSAAQDGSGSLPWIGKGRKLGGEEAERFAADVVEAYRNKTIRAICEETGRAYGTIHRILKHSGVTMRSKGQQPMGRRAAAAEAAARARSARRPAADSA
ncbi:helix-turn-helix domain-containing protein [Streptomyces sp. NPDC059631]|uniref:helix-turn-helix domain-containing protein n=1 Tax=unclassified Streptomyces TaxID=2593676 RepID=UPI003691CDA7